VDRRKLHILVKGGKADQVIVEVAKKLKVDLIVMGASSTGSKIGSLLGTTSERVVRHAHCSVLCVRPPKFNG